MILVKRCVMMNMNEGLGKLRLTKAGDASQNQTIGIKGSHAIKQE